jgi:serine/threonine protein kinase
MDSSYRIVLNQLVEENCITKIDSYQVKTIKKIGKGSQSQVWMAEYKGEIVAKKQLTQFDIRCIIHEIAILSKLEHQSIPKLLGVILDEVNGELSYVTSFINGKPLDEIDVNILDYDIKVHILKQISNILTFVHANNCVHRDIKAENIMLDEDYKVFLIDFGISKVLSNENILTRAKGTINYLPPEVFDTSHSNDSGQIISLVTTGVDVWGFACLTSYIFSGIVPWRNKCKKDAMIQKALVSRKEFPTPEVINKSEIVEIIRLGTNIDLNKRISMKDMNTHVQKL